MHWNRFFAELRQEVLQTANDKIRLRPDAAERAHAVADRLFGGGKAGDPAVAQKLAGDTASVPVARPLSGGGGGPPLARPLPRSTAAGGSAPPLARPAPASSPAAKAAPSAPTPPSRRE